MRRSTKLHSLTPVSLIFGFETQHCAVIGQTAVSSLHQCLHVAAMCTGHLHTFSRSAGEFVTSWPAAVTSRIRSNKQFTPKIVFIQN